MTGESAALQQAILVVDDEALVLMGTAAMLESLGYRAVKTTKSAEALVFLESDPDIVGLVTDQNMPGMDGIELAKAALTLRNDLAIVIATGNALTVAPDLPRYTMLYKPFTLSELEAATAGSFFYGGVIPSAG